MAQSISRGRAQGCGFQLEKCGFNQFNHQQLGTCRFNPLTLLFNLQNPSNWWFTDLGMFDMGDGHKIYGNVHGKLISKLWGTVSYIQGNRYEQENARLEHQNWDSSFKIVLWMSIYIYICLVYNMYILYHIIYIYQRCISIKSRISSCRTWFQSKDWIFQLHHFSYCTSGYFLY